HAFHLIEDARRLDHAYPLFRRAFAFAHTGLQRLLGHRLVGEHADPDLSAALHVTGHRDTAGFDLPRGEPAGFESLQAVIAERDLLPAGRQSTTAAALLFSEFDFLRHHHDVVPRPSPLRRPPTRPRLGHLPFVNP